MNLHSFFLIFNELTKNVSEKYSHQKIFFDLLTKRKGPKSISIFFIPESFGRN